jgi:hypothetical protein
VISSHERFGHHRIPRIGVVVGTERFGPCTAVRKVVSAMARIYNRLSLVKLVQSMHE